MIAWSVLTWFAGVVILAPLSSMVLGWHLGRGAYGIVGNEDLLAWLFTTRGISYLWILGTLALLLSVIRFSGYFWILENAAEGRGVALIDLFVRVARRTPRLLRLCAVAVPVGWIALMPLAAALWGTYGLFLGEHDPNYYLAERPPEWTHALLAGAAVLVIWIGVFGGVGLRLFFALPVYLDEGGTLRNAVRRSLQLTRGCVGRWAIRIASVLGSWGLVRIALNSLLFALGAITLSWVAELSPFLTPLIFSTALFVGLSFLLDALLGFLGFALLSTTIVEGYFESTNKERVQWQSMAHARGGGTPDGGICIKSWLRPRPLMLMGAVLAGGSIVFSAWFFDHSPPPRSVVISAHRAGPPPTPENTLAALEAAIEAGADYAEIDVLRTLDGVVVVTHDADLMRQAGVPRRINDTRFEDLRGIVKRGPEEIPEEERRLETLAAFLERAGDRIGLMVELKYYGPDPGLVSAVAEVLSQHQGETEVVLMSLDLGAVRALREQFPDHRVGYVSTVAVGQVMDLDIDFLALARNRVTRSAVLSARERGIELHAWTPNRIDHIADLVQLGVDGIITDYPRRARAVEREINAMSPVERFLLRFRRLILESVEDYYPLQELHYDDDERPMEPDYIVD
ncbi:MAG: hypothetical protein JJU20_10120 [Opitutales bacterium]|nr:hypothetical protein [Opitutales bacterium]